MISDTYHLTINFLFLEYETENIFLCTFAGFDCMGRKPGTEEDGRPYGRLVSGSAR